MNDKTTLNLEIDESLKRILNQQAYKEGLDLSKFVRKALQQYMVVTNEPDIRAKIQEKTYQDYIQAHFDLN